MSEREALYSASYVPRSCGEGIVGNVEYGPDSNHIQPTGEARSARTCDQVSKQNDRLICGELHNFYRWVGVNTTPLPPPGKLICPLPPLLENLNRELIRKILIPLHTRMQIIPTIKFPPQLTRNLRIREPHIEIHHLIKRATFSNKLINALSSLFSLGVAVRLAGEVTGRGERRDGSAEDGDTVRVDQRDHLLICLDQVVVDGRLGLGSRCAGTDVIYAFEDHCVLDARVREDVSVNPAKSIRAQAVCENTISAGSQVAEGDVFGGWAALETTEEQVGPAVVLVGCRAAAVGDGVADDEEGA